MRNIDRTLFSQVDQTNAHGRHRKIRHADRHAGMPVLKWPCKRITMHKYIIYNPYLEPSFMSNSWLQILHIDIVCKQTHMYGNQL